MLERNKIEHFFVDVVTVDDIKNGKPHPDLFLKAAENQGILSKNWMSSPHFMHTRNQFRLNG